ncbi:asparagine synthase-related protein [Pseudomonas sp. ABY48]|uniref:asparagine synthase-related protein n=1 Tax=Pseudomonas sp. ABY48 TaxID=3402865 RepID=UPI003B433AF9
MLKCKIHRIECFDQPFIEGHTYRWSEDYYLSILNNPAISSTLFYSRERWACIINYISPSEKTNTPLKVIPFPSTRITDIYEKFGCLDAEGVLVELVNGNGGSALRVISTREGSIPLYFSCDSAVINMSWDFKEIALFKKSLILDFEYLVKSTFEPTYTNRTAFQGVSMITAGSAVTLSDTGCKYNYPTVASETDQYRHTNLNDAKEHINYLLTKKIFNQLSGSSKLAIELSGGLDSSTVAIAARQCFCKAEICTYGIIVSDPLLADSQINRRNNVIEFISSQDYRIDITEHLPSYTSSANERYYLNAEAYADAFEHIWSQAAMAGHNTLLNGCGGDELFPQFAGEDFSLDRLRSITDKAWQSFNALLSDRLNASGREVLESQFLSCAPATGADTGTMLAMARRAPLLLHLNLVPLYPLRDSKIIDFCERLPFQLRVNKKLFEDSLRSTLKSNCFSDYPKETFMHADEISLLKDKDSLLRTYRKLKIVEIGLIDATPLRRDLEHLNKDSPRFVYDYLLNILSIERFLEAYL